MIGRLARLRRDQRGATSIEYGLIMSFVVLAMLGALAELASSTNGMWNMVSDKVMNAG